MVRKKFQSLKNRLAEIDKELKTLARFRPTKALTEFKRRLEGEKSYVKQQLKSQRPRKETAKERQRKLAKAQRMRKVKNERGWRYFGAIAKNYDLDVRKVRSEHTKKRKGLKTSISDIIWKNPSP